MSALSTCPKCGGGTSTVQVGNVISKQCKHCGALPFASSVKTGKPVKVGRSMEGESQ